MSFRVVVLPHAARDYEALRGWIAERSPEGAARWTSAFADALRRLEHDPESYGLAPEARHHPEPIRQFLFRTRRGRTYRGLFTVSGDAVYVLHVRGPRQRVMRPDEIERPPG